MKRNKEYYIITYFFLALFSCLIVYIIGFQLFKSEETINNPYNKRTKLYAENVSRGKILSADGKTLAYTKINKKGKEKRKYPYDNMFSHAIGYSTHGETGIELEASFELVRSHEPITDKINHLFSNEKNVGDSVVTTFNYDLQKTAYDALGSYDGAVICMDPTNGKILCMVSKPDFNPNDVSKKYESIIKDSNGNDTTKLLNRAMQGSYTPGSVFKIITTLAYLNTPDTKNIEYDCCGKCEVENNTISCYHNEVHGKIKMKDAFSHSCNCYYANLANYIDTDTFKKTASKCLFDKPLPTKYPSTKSHISIDKKDLEYTSIGQGKTTLSPFHMLLISSAIYNKGVLMTPYEIDEIINVDGKTVKRNTPSEYGRLMTEENAKKLDKYMKATCEYGTAKALKNTKYKTAGKTGSAEISDSSNDTHAWFVGYAYDKDGKSIAIAVIVEKKGTGSTYAVPIAKKVFDVYFQN